MNLRNAGRLWRTISSLHPLQIATRPWRAFDQFAPPFPAGRPPALRQTVPRASDTALADFAESEKARAAGRIPHLPRGSLLREFEEACGFDAGAARGPSEPHPAWKGKIAARAYPSSIRARRLAVAAHLGRRNVARELARACRAVLLQPELHLLGNHLLENGFALVCGGAVSDGGEADVWWHAGSSILAWQLPEQFLADGGHFERSASYHIALTAGLLECIHLAAASGRAIPSLWRTTAERAVDWMLAVKAPDGTYPLLNDAALDAAPTIEIVEALASSCGIQPQRDPHTQPSTLAPRMRRLADTGWILGEGPDDTWLVFDAGADGAPYQGAHVHADPLTFELWVKGKRTVVDYGISSYAWGSERQETRSTRVHNTVEVAGIDASEVWGAFRVGRRAHATVIDSGETSDSSWVEASHDGYRWLAGSPIHRRKLTLRSSALEIHDTIDGETTGFASRLRFDAAVFANVRVTASHEFTCRPGLWYPIHGESREAVVLEQETSASSNREMHWSLAW